MGLANIANIRDELRNHGLPAPPQLLL